MSSDFYDLSAIQEPNNFQPEIVRRDSQANILRRVSQAFILICFCVILFVSAIDTWFASANSRILYEEANPICAWLIRLAPDSCCCFIIGKTLGTLIVLLILYRLWQVKYRYAMIIIVSVTAFQIALLAFLCLSDPKMDDWINFSILFDETETSIFHILNPAY